jgi:hypothetical protein
MFDSEKPDSIAVFRKQEVNNPLWWLNAWLGSDILVIVQYDSIVGNVKNLMIKMLKEILVTYYWFISKTIASRK